MLRIYLLLITLLTFSCNYQEKNQTIAKWTPSYIGDKNLTLDVKFEEEKDRLDSKTSQIIALGYRHDTTAISVALWAPGHNQFNGSAKIENDSLKLFYWINDSLACDTSRLQLHIAYYLNKKIKFDSLSISPIYIDSHAPRRKNCP